MVQLNGIKSIQNAILLSSSPLFGNKGGNLSKKKRKKYQQQIKQVLRIQTYSYWIQFRIRFLKKISHPDPDPEPAKYLSLKYSRNSVLFDEENRFCQTTNICKMFLQNFLFKVANNFLSSTYANARLDQDPEPVPICSTDSTRKGRQGSNTESIDTAQTYSGRRKYCISLFSKNCKFLKIVIKKVKYLGTKRFVSGYRGT